MLRFDRKQQNSVKQLSFNKKYIFKKSQKFPKTLKKIFFCDVDLFKSLYYICYNIVSVFMFWFFGCEACGILVPQSGIESAPLALEGKVLTTGLPGKSPKYILSPFSPCSSPC